MCYINFNKLNITGGFGRSFRLFWMHNIAEIENMYCVVYSVSHDWSATIAESAGAWYEADSVLWCIA